MTRIDYFLSPASPFVYIAGTRAEEIADRHSATLVYRPVDAIALFARTGGVPPGERHENRKAYRLQEIRRQAKKAGLAVNPEPRHFPTNAAPASYAIIAAQEAGGGDLGALVHGLAAACWANELDIADDAVVRDCLAAAGFEPTLADSGLLAGAETYARNLETAVARGAFGVPFYVTDDDARFWGQDRLDDLDAHLSGRL